MKHFTKSKTILGAILTLFATIMPEIISVEEADGLAQLIMQLIGIGLVIYGRFKAVERVTL